MAEGINVNERGELINSNVPNVEAVPIQTVVDFLSEFNTNAAIFNGILGPVLDFVSMASFSNRLSIGDLTTDVSELRTRVTLLEIANKPSNADNPAFDDCAHAPPGEPC